MKGIIDAASYVPPPPSEEKKKRIEKLYASHPKWPPFYVFVCVIYLFFFFMNASITLLQADKKNSSPILNI